MVGSFFVSRARVAFWGTGVPTAQSGPLRPPDDSRHRVTGQWAGGSGGASDPSGTLKDVRACWGPSVCQANLGPATRGDLGVIGRAISLLPSGPERPLYGHRSRALRLAGPLPHAPRLVLYGLGVRWCGSAQFGRSCHEGESTVQGATLCREAPPSAAISCRLAGQEILLSSDSDRDATVHGKDHPGDVARLPRCQERDRIRHLAGVGKAAHGYGALNLGPLLGRDGRDHAGLGVG